MSRWGGLTAALLVLCAAGPAGADAAIVSGSNLGATPNGGTCASLLLEPLSCTVAISALPPSSAAPGGARAGVSGVIVGWKVRSGGSAVDTKVRLRVIRGIRGAGSGPVETIPKAVGEYSYAARVPIEAGDQFGLDMIGVIGFDTPLILHTTPDSSFSYWDPALADGEERAKTVPDQEDLEVEMNITIEVDADHDGYGDETQDACPTVANNGGPCPPPALPPNTKITKGPKGTIKGSKATFRFKSEPAGARFECKLDRKKFKSCKSPKTYKGLAAGRHTFSVRAVSASGASDSSPAKRSFKIAP